MLPLIIIIIIIVIVIVIIIIIIIALNGWILITKAIHFVDITFVIYVLQDLHPQQVFHFSRTKKYFAESL